MDYNGGYKMKSYIFIIFFSILGTINFIEYKKTKRIYKLLTLIPIIGVVLLESPMKLYISNKTDLILSLIVFIIYIIILLLDWIDKRSK